MIDVIIDNDVDADLPNQESIESAIHLTCKVAGVYIDTPHVCIRFASDNIVQELNAQWRDKNKVTDVLSFPMQEGDIYRVDEPLGDMILAVPFVIHEAQRLEHQTHAHILHLIIHGMLHLLGYDHIQDDEAHTMQSLESRIMKELHLHQPYAHELSDHV
ncbi:MAG: rRNA maturation RNase YbeY [Mariprofundaceae bacterium]|nr:rRNA maturation RNase YbeY [Mariprofundaceae bacterium]